MSGSKQKTSSHPPVATMVTVAIRALNERKGSSLQAIKKYITTNYEADIGRLARFIRQFLKTAVDKGDLIQPKGKGATGSFKLNNKKAQPKMKRQAKAKASSVGEKKAGKAPAKPKPAKSAPERKQLAMEKKAGASPKIAKAPKAVKSPKKAAVTKKSAPKKAPAK